MSQHGPSTRIYYMVFAALLVLTGLTVWVSYAELGEWHFLVGMTIAVCKATLVVLFFMHLAYSKKLTALVFVSALVWLVIMFVLTFSDYLTRQSMPV